ncbi:D-amino acid dehydrogenase [Burkholderiales bacterium]|nr:D-amino acid dehydrogenase [Burkholderiales bacterium]
MRVLVIGAGVVGVASAWFLAKRGHEVQVIDQEPGSGLVTSYANGGQISVSQAEPWSNPGAPLKVLKWLGQEDAPLLFRMRADFKQWSWGLRFLLECFPSKTKKNMLDILKLGIYSRQCLQELRENEGLQYHQITKGILQIHTDDAEFEAAKRRLVTLLEYGLDMSVCTTEGLFDIEPALKQSSVPIVGATYAADDESGDAHIFTRQLEEACIRRFGVAFNYDTKIIGFLGSGDTISGVRIIDKVGEQGITRADAYVVATGSVTDSLLRPIGLGVPIFPVKGYSLTVPVSNPSLAPQVCITDENGKVAMSRLGNFLRMAGTAELNGFDVSVNDERCAGILKRVKKLFPEGMDYKNAKKWAGLRPMTPSSVPVIGRTRFGNLFLNAGHGTLGWTLACGSGSAIADIVSGESPEIDFSFN